MRTPTRPLTHSLAGLSAGVLLLGGLLSGCGGGDDSSAEPSSASTTASSATDTGATGGTGTVAQDADTEKFCSAYAEIVTSGSDDLAVQKKAIDELQAIGVPKSMDADARAGYQLLVDAITTAKTADELSSLGEKLSQSDTDKLLSFSQYLTTSCASQLGVGN